MQMITPVILSGGSGSRLWPMSRAAYPKQFLALSGEQTLIQQAALRVRGAGYTAPIIVSNEEHRFVVAEQLRQIGCDPAAILLEPVGRNTAPAVAIAALQAEALGHDLILVMPSDHVIRDQVAFDAAIQKAAQAARDGALVTFGITPDQPETGYGYIRAGAELDRFGGVHHVAAFVEKPNRETAEAYLAEGDYLWNSGIFLFSARTYLEELKAADPDMLAGCEAALNGSTRDLTFCRLDKAAFIAIRSDSIDYAVMEKTQRAAVVPIDMGWSDLGAWSALWNIGEKDDRGNVSRGDVVLSDVADSYIRSEDRLVAVVGLENVAVITTDDAVLVARRDRVQDVKTIVDQLKHAGRTEATLHSTVHRPWGSYRGIDAGVRYQVKRITVAPGAQLSLQMHHHRAEHWIVVSGMARVTRGEEVFLLSENESTYIRPGQVHRLENPGKLPLHLIEVQSGGYLGEDDIVRFEDGYGRV